MKKYRKSELREKDCLTGHRQALQHTGTKIQRDLCKQADDLIKNAFRRSRAKQQAEASKETTKKKKKKSQQQPRKPLILSELYQFPFVDELTEQDLEQLSFANKEKKLVERLASYLKSCSAKNLKSPTFIKNTTKNFLRTVKNTDYDRSENALYRLYSSSMYLLKNGTLPRRFTDFVAKSTNSFVSRLKEHSTASEDAAKLLLEENIDTKFLFQEQLLGYVGDFVNYELRMVIEIDGEYHMLRESYDKRRDKHLSDHGFITLRFSNSCIHNEKDVFLSTVKYEIERRKKLLQ